MKGSSLFMLGAHFLGSLLVAFYSSQLRTYFYIKAQECQNCNDTYKVVKFSQQHEYPPCTLTKLVNVSYLT